MRIGEAFVFGEDAPRPDGDREQLDLYCQDIRGSVSLACLQGGAQATAFQSSLGLPDEAIRAFAFLKSAPQDLPLRELRLSPSCTPDWPGIGLARGLNGLVYKLCLVESIPHAEALRRTATIRYEAIGQEPGGGILLVPTTKGRPSDSILAAIQLGLERGNQIPNQNFSRDLRGDYQTADELLDKTSLVKREHLALTAPLSSLVTINTRGAVFAASGIVLGGRIELHKYGAMGVLGNMAGSLLVDSYGYVYIDGSLDGSLEIKSYATVYLRGDLRGSMKVRSYTKAYFGGSILGTLDTRSSGWCTFYFDGLYGAQELAEMGLTSVRSPCTCATPTWLRASTRVWAVGAR